jgi:hypothetical protein
MKIEKLYKKHAKLKKLFFKTRKQKENLEFKMFEISQKLTKLIDEIRKTQDDGVKQK